VIAPIIWMLFLFVLGACVGSFLNVVVYRLPAGMSIVQPGSHCTSCQHPIGWYDNLPILSWFLLRGRCRHCEAEFSLRYAAVEFVTAFLFVGLYIAYFKWEVRGLMPAFESGGWLVYGGHIVLLCCLLASSLIDADHMIIDLRICRFCAAVGLLLSIVWPYWLDGPPETLWRLAPYASPRTAALALGGALGLLLGHLLLQLGVLKRSYVDADSQSPDAPESSPPSQPSPANATAQDQSEPIAEQIGILRVVAREVGFLLPVVLLALLFIALLTGTGALADPWTRLITSQKWLAGLLGSVFGFMIGGAVVWTTRIFGSLAFRREAMGAGDVELMAMVGAVLGPASPVIAFFLAPFFGLGWAVTRLITHRTREIPYGPFLSMATVVVMVMHDPIVDYFLGALGR